jgi:hypothetical protein
VCLCAILSYRGAPLATFRCMVSEAASVARRAAVGNVGTVGASGIEACNATSLALTLFLEGAIVACDDGRSDAALRMGTEVLSNGGIGADGAVLRVLHAVVHTARTRGSSDDALLAEVTTRCTCLASTKMHLLMFAWRVGKPWQTDGI